MLKLTTVASYDRRGEASLMYQIERLDAIPSINDCLNQQGINGWPLNN